MNYPKTVEQARALEEKTEMDLLNFPGKSPLGVPGDCIWLFIDSDGRRMRVEPYGDRCVKVEGG